MNAQTVSIHAPPPIDEGREYAKSRIYHIYYEHKEKLATKFLREDRPTTYGEARQWIKDGKFLIDLNEDKKDTAEYNHYDWEFRWGNKPRDYKGYEASMLELKKAHQHVQDIIGTLSDEHKRLEALKAFEAWTH